MTTAPHLAAISERGVYPNEDTMILSGVGFGGVLR